MEGSGNAFQWNVLSPGKNLRSRYRRRLLLGFVLDSDDLRCSCRQPDLDAVTTLPDFSMLSIRPSILGH